MDKPVCEHHPRFILYYQDKGPPFCAACEIEVLHRGLDELERRLRDGCSLINQDDEWVVFDANGECNDDAFAVRSILNLVRKLGTRTD